MQETSTDLRRREAQRRENILGGCVVVLFAILVFGMAGNCCRGIRFFDEAAGRAMRCSTVEELRSAIPDEWLHEQNFVKDGKRFIRISVHIKPPKFATHPLAFKDPAFIFDVQGRKVDQCLREYDACEFRRRWQASYTVAQQDEGGTQNGSAVRGRLLNGQ